MSGDQTPDRRPIPARQSRWAVALAAWLARRGVAPDLVSLLGFASAALAGAALLLTRSRPFRQRSALLLAAAALLQLRLLCNLLDGMIAVEGGRGTKRGPVFNELPDRLSDAVALVCAGYAAGMPAWAAPLGWSAAMLAVLTAYVRALAGSLGAPQDFGGPMAKQRRMDVLTAACVAGAALRETQWAGAVFGTSLAAVTLGSAATVARRTAHLVRELEAR